jgi:hypothetical protein
VNCQSVVEGIVVVEKLPNRSGISPMMATVRTLTLVTRARGSIISIVVVRKAVSVELLLSGFHSNDRQE